MELDVLLEVPGNHRLLDAQIQPLVPKSQSPAFWESPRQKYRTWNHPEPPHQVLVAEIALLSEEAEDFPLLEVSKNQKPEE
jgi:hypothetical protein